MRKVRILILVMSVLISPAVKAQEQLNLNLDSAMAFALAYNKMLKTSGYQVDKAQEQLKETVANGLPQVDATLDYSNFFGVSTEFRISENMP
ncbi:MAG TPA: TolC family protein, partial [Bacteroidales bacterium]|nr:TolC family protein [Bacteroidales bacterium]